MKKFIYIFGIILLNIFAFGAIFKVMHWPGAGILLSLGLGLFAIVFMPMAFLNNYRGIGKKHLSLHMAGFICALICIIGALFKIQHWPGAGVLLIVGVPLPFLYFLPVYLYHQNKEKEKSVLNFLGVMFLMLYISVFSAMLSLSISGEVVASMVVSSDDLSKTTKLYHAKNMAMYEKLDSMASAEDKGKIASIQTKSTEICKKIEAVKTELIRNIDGEDTPAIKGGELNYKALMAKNESAFTTQFMRGDDGASGKAAELKSLLNNYREFLATLVKDNKEALSRLDVLLGTRDVTETVNGESQSITWEDAYFQNGLFAIMVLGNLDCIETNVKLAESEALEFLTVTPEKPIAVAEKK